jgi:tetratricopeptide (TPR) repeat protein
LDPNFALARVWYADYLLIVASTGGSPRLLTPAARREVQKAMDLDPNLSEANALMGVLEGNCDYDWEEAGRRFRLALAQEPLPPTVRAWYAWFYLLPMGRKEEAIVMYQDGLKQDPLNVVVKYCYAACLLVAGRRSEAESELRQLLEIDPRFYAARGVLAFLLHSRGEQAEALEQVETAYRIAPYFPTVVGVLAALLEQNGQLERAEEALRRLRESPSFKPPQLMTFHLSRGDAEKAAECLEMYIEERVPVAAQHFRVAQAFCPGPRWAAIAKKMNLPE